MRVWCEGCGRREAKGVRCLPSGGRPVVLVRRKRRWRRPGCGVKSWTEASEEVRSRSVLSERARREAVRQAGSRRNAAGCGGSGAGAAGIPR